MMTRKRVVDDFYKQAEADFNDGWKRFAEENQRRNHLQLERMFRLLTASKGIEFTGQLRGLMHQVKAEKSVLRVVREPTGFRVKDKRFPLFPYIWVDAWKEVEGSKYAYVCVQIKIDRWLRFIVWQ